MHRNGKQGEKQMQAGNFGSRLRDRRIEDRIKSLYSKLGISASRRNNIRNVYLVSDDQ